MNWFKQKSIRRTFYIGAPIIIITFFLVITPYVFDFSTLTRTFLDDLSKGTNVKIEYDSSRLTLLPKPRLKIKNLTFNSTSKDFLNRTLLQIPEFHFYFNPISLLNTKYAGFFQIINPKLFHLASEKKNILFDVLANKFIPSSKFNISKAEIINAKYIADQNNNLLDLPDETSLSGSLNFTDKTGNIFSGEVTFPQNNNKNVMSGTVHVLLRFKSSFLNGNFENCLVQSVLDFTNTGITLKKFLQKPTGFAAKLSFNAEATPRSLNIKPITIEMANIVIGGRALISDYNSWTSDLKLSFPTSPINKLTELFPLKTNFPDLASANSEFNLTGTLSNKANISGNLLFNAKSNDATFAFDLRYQSKPSAGFTLDYNTLYADPKIFTNLFFDKNYLLSKEASTLGKKIQSMLWLIGTSNSADFLDKLQKHSHIVPQNEKGSDNPQKNRKISSSHTGNFELKQNILNVDIQTKNEQGLVFINGISTEKPRFSGAGIFISNEANAVISDSEKSPIPGFIYSEK